MRKRAGGTAGLLCLVLGGLMVLAFGRAAPRDGHRDIVARKAPVAVNYLKLPLNFVRNLGQVGNDPQRKVDFFSAGQGYTLFLTSSEAALALEKDRGGKSLRPQGIAINGGSAEPRRAVLRMKLANANPHAALTGMDELPGKNNYFIGNKPSEWHTQVPTYAKVKYRNVYPGVDLIFYGNQRHLEFDFVVSPGDDPHRIGFDLEGATKVKSDLEGNLAAEIGGGTVWFHKPLIFQPAARSGDDPAGKRIVEGGYVLGPSGRVSFRVADYDKKKPLIIDPTLSYSTFLGGSGDDSGSGIAVDSSGNAYVTGSTASANFPTASPLTAALSGSVDAFVAKLDPSGTSLVYSTFLGGNNVDRGSAIAVDSSGDAFVAGTTSSPDFPTTTGALQTSFAGGATDAFVAKLNPAGDTLAYATYMGGTGSDTAHTLALDSIGDAFVAGDTQSTDFPTLGAFQGASGGQGDAFLSKLKPDGSGLVYSTYLGGSGADSGQAVAVDPSGDAYLTGYTYSTDFPTASPYQAANAGSADVFITKFNPAGTALVYSTYLGGAGLDRSTSIALDASQNIYVAGYTASSAFPTTSGVIQTANHGNGDAFVAKLNANGATLSYSTYLGGSLVDQASGIAVDSSGNAFITGYTQSSDFSLLNPVDAAFGGGTCGSGPCFDAFVTEINSTATALVYSTYLGGNANDYGAAVAVDASDNAYVTGSASSSNFPVTAAVQSTIGSSGSAGDAFVAKISPANAPAASLSPQSLTFADQATGTTSSPMSVRFSNYGTVQLNIASITASGDFAQTNDCGSSLAAGGSSCTINVTFSPTATGALTGQVTIDDNAQGSPHIIQLSGNGVTPAPAVNLSPGTLTFADQTVGTTSAPQTMTLTNSGSAILNVTSIQTTGNFAETNNCPSSLAVGASCAINVTFSPQGSGSLTGTIVITDDASNSPQTYNLNGTGIAEFSISSDQSSVTLDGSATSTAFKITLSAPQSFTGTVALSCTNNGSATCAFSPATLTTGQTSTLTVGNLAAVVPNALNVQVVGTFGSETDTISISVLFKNFTLAMSPPLLSLNAGQTGSYALTVTPVNGFTGDVSLACSNLPKETTCTPDPASVTLDGSSTANVTVNLATTANSMLVPGGGPFASPPGSGQRILVFGFLLMGLLILLANRRRVLNHQRTWVGVALLVLLVMAWVSCNSSYYNPVTSQVAPPGTPPGNYTVVLTGTTSAVTRTTSANLVVK